MRLSKSSFLESQVELCTATIQSTAWVTTGAACQRPAMSWRALRPYPGMRACREGSSPYVIQGVSATVRGQAKLNDEGEPQGGNRQAPEPPDTQCIGVQQEGW